MDLNMMMREQAKTTLQTQLDGAVANGDAELARKVSDQLAQLAVQTAPKAPPFGDIEIKAALGTVAPWFGLDPRKTSKAMQYGKDMDPRKFSTAEDFAKALVAAVDEEFKPAPAAGEGEGEEGEEGGEGAEDPPAKRAQAKRTDAPREGETDPRPRAGGRTGPWSKLSDAPQEVRAEITRTAAKFLPANATKEARETFTKRQLEAQYAIHQRNKKAK